MVFSPFGVIYPKWKSFLYPYNSYFIYYYTSYWSWNSNTLATWCEELTHLKRPWSWERLKAGGEGDDRGWDGWMSSLTQWTWVWVNSRSWWWTGKPGGLQSMGSQRVGHDWATELNWQQLLIQELSLVAESGASCMDLLWWLLLLRHAGFKQGLSSCAWAYLLCGVWNLLD